jgi:hypothetical protein
MNQSSAIDPVRRGASAECGWMGSPRSSTGRIWVFRKCWCSRALLRRRRRIARRVNSMTDDFSADAADLKREVITVLAPVGPFLNRTDHVGCLGHAVGSAAVVYVVNWNISVSNRLAHRADGLASGTELSIRAQSSSAQAACTASPASAPSHRGRAVRRAAGAPDLVARRATPFGSREDLHLGGQPRRVAARAEPPVRAAPKAAQGGGAVALRPGVAAATSGGSAPNHAETWASTVVYYTNISSRTPYLDILVSPTEETSIYASFASPIKLLAATPTDVCRRSLVAIPVRERPFELRPGPRRARGSMSDTVCPDGLGRRLSRST